MNYTQFSDKQIGKMIGVLPSQIKLRDRITGFPRIIHKTDENESLKEYLPFTSSKSNYDKNLCSYIKEIAIQEGLFLDDVKDKDLYDELIGDEDIFEKYKFKDFWKYQIELNKSTILSEIAKDEYDKNFENIDPSSNFINNIPKSLQNKALNIVNDNREEDYYLNACENTVWGLQNYQQELFNEGTFLNDLYECKSEGIGKGEIVSAYLINKSYINGTSESYDLITFEDKKRSELKSMPSWNSSYKIGTKGGIGQSKFYNNITAAIRLMNEFLNDPGEEYFKQYVSNDFYLLTKQFLNETIDILRGEIYTKELILIELWFFMAHTELYKINHSNDIKQNLISRKFESEGNLLKALESLRYVKDPLNFQKDIKTDIEKFFDIDYLVVFDEKRKIVSIVTSPEELTLDVISQNNLKIIEKRCKQFRPNIELETFKKWKEDKSLNYYDLYVNMEKQLLNVC